MIILDSSSRTSINHNTEPQNVALHVRFLDTKYLVSIGGCLIRGVGTRGHPLSLPEGRGVSKVPSLGLELKPECSQCAFLVTVNQPEEPLMR